LEIEFKFTLVFLHPLPYPSKGRGEKALELSAGILIKGCKNMVPKRPDFIQKIAWLPATG